MSTVTDLDKLKINYLTQAQYDSALANNEINANELYFTPVDDMQSNDLIINLDVTAKTDGRATAGADMNLYNALLDYAPTALDTDNNTFALKEALYRSLIRPAIWGGSAITDSTTLALNKVDKETPFLELDTTATSGTDKELYDSLVDLNLTDVIV